LLSMRFPSYFHYEKLAHEFYIFIYIYIILTSFCGLNSR